MPQTQLLQRASVNTWQKKLETTHNGRNCFYWYEGKFKRQLGCVYYTLPYFNFRFLIAAQTYICLSWNPYSMDMQLIAEHDNILCIYEIWLKSRNTHFISILLNISWLGPIPYAVEISQHFGEMLILLKTESTSHIRKLSISQMASYSLTFFILKNTEVPIRIRATMFYNWQKVYLDIIYPQWSCKKTCSIWQIKKQKRGRGQDSKRDC